MANIVVPDRRYTRQKPPRGSRINLAHPLADNLDAYYPVNEHGGLPADIVRGSRIAISGAPNPPVWTPRGIYQGGSNLLVPTNRTGSGDEFTILVRFTNRASTAGSVIQRASGAGTTLVYNNSGQVLFDAGSAAQRISTSGINVNDGGSHTFVATYKSTSQRLYYKGRLAGSRTPSLASHTWSDGNATISTAHNVVETFAWYPVALPDDMARWLSAEPWALTEPPQPRRIYSIAAGGTDETVNANVLTLTATIPAATISTGSTVNAAVQSIAASVQSPSVSAGVTISPAVQTLTASLTAPSVSTSSGSGTWDDNPNTWDDEPGTWDNNGASPGVTVSANVLSLTASIPAVTVSASSTVLVSVQTLTLGTQAVTVPNFGFSASVLELVLSVLPVAEAGDLTSVPPVQPPALPDEVGAAAQHWQRAGGPKKYTRRTGRSPRNPSRFH